jgi:hypothetical protein
MVKNWARETENTVISFLGQKRSDQKRQLAKNGLKIKVVEPAEGYLAVFTVLQETP